MTYITLQVSLEQGVELAPNSGLLFFSPSLLDPATPELVKLRYLSVDKQKRMLEEGKIVVLS